MQVAIQAPTVAGIELGETDAGPAAGASTANAAETCIHRYG